MKKKEKLTPIVSYLQECNLINGNAQEAAYHCHLFRYL